MKEAEEYHHHVVVDQRLGARGHMLALRKITPQTYRWRFHASARQMAHGNSGVPIVGDPDHIAQAIDRPEPRRPDRDPVSLVNYADELRTSAPRCCAAGAGGLRLPIPA